MKIPIALAVFAGLLFLNCSDSSAQTSSDSTEFKTETIEVDALRGIERYTPATFENIDRDEIERKYTLQDLPMFLKGNTSINAYSESGSSVGYSYLTIRGFDQRRISILINGIPQNDPEDHQVYWVDISDITASLEDIQIQRGVGTALYGASSIGGVVNIRTIDYFSKKFLNFSGGYGNFNSRRYSAEYSSGAVTGGLGFYGKISRIATDGYRDLSWSDHWSYFLSAGKTFGDKALLKFNAYGSPIRNHLAYLGITRSDLEGGITGDKLRDRKTNYLTYPDETDNYFQPHYEIEFDYQVNEDLFFGNTLSFISGDGYFNTFFPVSYGYDFPYFNLSPFFVNDSAAFSSSYYKRNPDGTLYYEKGRGYQIERSDIVSRLTVNNRTFGWFPQVVLKHSGGKGSFTAGGELRLHQSERFGEVKFGNALPPGTQPEHMYYFFNGNKTTASVYANEIYSVTGKLDMMAGLQYVYHNYRISNDRFRPYEFSVPYSFFNPRIGANYNFTKTLSAYVNVAFAQREPRLKDIYDGENPYAKPSFGTYDASAGIYENPLVKQEKMIDYEAGFRVSESHYDVDANFYFMDFKDEIVNNGALDNVGQPISGNAGRSAHIGGELSFLVKPLAGRIAGRFSLTGNINVSDNYFNEYREILGSDSLGNIVYGNDYSGNRILLSPGILGNISLNYDDMSGINAYIQMQYVGRQYLDNSENDIKDPAARETPGYVSKDIGPYSVMNAGINIDLAGFLENRSVVSKMELLFKANNILNRLYETTGSMSFGTPYWIPAATRNFFAEIRLGF